MPAKDETDNTLQLDASSTPGNIGTRVREDTLDDFSAAWCQDLLNDPIYVAIEIATRRLGGPQGASWGSLMAKTLNTDNTIRAMRLLYRPPPAQQSQIAQGTVGKGDEQAGGEVLALMSLGDELCSHTNVLHGGINTTIVDEIGGELAGRTVKDHLMAVNFNVNLRKSVKTPGIIIVRAWMERPPEGRKVWVKCRIEQDGQTCIESENLYVKIAPRGKL